MAIKLIENLNELTQPDLPTPDFELQYNPLVEGHIEDAKKDEHIKGLDLSRTPLRVVVENVDLLTPQQFTMIRRFGFGASDSSVLMGVNPYQTLADLIKQKASDKLSEEEKQVSQKVAVRKGNDLEPLIIDKAAHIFDKEIIKPKDMYEFAEHPVMRINFDGVINDPKQYIPCEIKVATVTGQRHYNPNKAIYDEVNGWRGIPPNVTTQNYSIQTKAGIYGIPPYYYTQLQVEIAACAAPFGYLACLFDADWIVHVFFAWADKAVQEQIFINAYKAWGQVEQLKKQIGPTQI